MPIPCWDDYLELGFDEIRQFGGRSVQVMRRLRAALTSVAESLPDADRRAAVTRYLSHLDSSIDESPLDIVDKAIARQEDRQGLGLTRKRGEARTEADVLSHPTLPGC